MQETSPITAVKGIGPKSSLNFEKAGIHLVRDLITYYPRTYESFEAPAPAGSLSAFDDGKLAAVEGTIQTALSVRFLRSMRITTGKIYSGGVFLDVTWYNMPYMRAQVKPGCTYVFRGRIKAKGTKVFLQQPKVYDIADYEALRKSLQPVYPLVRGLTENSLRKALREVFYGDDRPDLSGDPLPEEIRERFGLMAWKDAVRAIHFPKDAQTLSKARRRLVFDEFFYFILMLRRVREARGTRTHSYVLPACAETERVLSSLPYELTGAQKRVWQEITRDLSRKTVTARLIQGDVGSGKTILAFLALIQTACAGYQGALMVPTEVLARQHFEAFNALTEKAGIFVQAVLLTGSLKAAERREAYRRVAEGEAKVVIGTHALIQDKVEYRALGLVITDEQHRFGVHQREALEEKGEMPDTIVMSATPIPRTLAVILYGDLDVSLVNEMPSSRLPVKNAVVDTKWRPNAYRFIAQQVKAGHQVYVICPMVEESEELDAENVIDYTETLRAALSRLAGGIRVEYLHGKMKNTQKTEIMEQFSANEIQVLVSTTVVEVGVNVPNATVMMVENAERFGLAQLHQLRGRVGRGKDQSYCIFMYAQESEEVKKRLEILASTNNGFEIAEKDLELRGPGELFGVRQSGELSFALADIYADAPVLKSAGDAAALILGDDPGLVLDKHRGIADKLAMQEKERGEHALL